MASSNDPAALTPDQLRIIDQARQRLDQLTQNIEAVRHAVLLGRPMPDIAAIQAHSEILKHSSTHITAHLSTHADLLSTIVAYPSTNFPGRTQEPLAGHLLRKKVEPNVEAWVEEGRAVGEGRDGSGDGGKDGALGKLEGEWQYAGGYAAIMRRRAIRGMRRRKVEMGGRRTKAEIEDEGEEEEEEEEDEDEEMGEVEMEMDGQEKAAVSKEAQVGGQPDENGTPRNVQQMARFMNTGIMPAQSFGAGARS